jgi:hypothetical protein
MWLKWEKFFFTPFKGEKAWGDGKKKKPPIPKEKKLEPKSTRE